MYFMGPLGPPRSLQPNRAIRYIPYVSSRTAGAPGSPTGKGGENREGRSEHHQRRRQLWQGCGPRSTYGYNDTCVGYASQRRTPRHQHGGRHVDPMERQPAAVCSAFDKWNVKRKIRTARRCGFCHLMRPTVGHIFRTHIFDSKFQYVYAGGVDYGAKQATYGTQKEFDRRKRR